MDRGTNRGVSPEAAFPTTAAAIPPRSPAPAPPAMLRGFTKDGSIHLLGGHTLPDGIFVKIVRE